MGRIHLFEFGDLEWWPLIWRHYLTDFLSEMAVTAFTQLDALPVDQLAALFKEAFAATGEQRLLDLGSGSGAPVIAMRQALADRGLDVELLLTDLVPNAPALETACRAAGPGVDWHRQAVDAADVPPDLAGFRTMVNAFHHLRPPLARRVLADAVDKRRGILVVEAPARLPLTMLGMVTAVPAMALVLAPRIRPQRLSRLFWTYAVPVLPPMIAFDGLISCLRTYSPDELRALTADLGGADWRWRIDRLKAPGSPLILTMLLGYPLP